MTRIKRRRRRKGKPWHEGLTDQGRLIYELEAQIENTAPKVYYGSPAEMKRFFEWWRILRGEKL